MTAPAEHLVRCVACGRNFETRQTGRLKCPVCGVGIWLEPPEPVAGFEPPTERVDPPAPAGAPSGPEPDIETFARLVEDGVRLASAAQAAGWVPAWEAGQGSLPKRFVATLRQLVTAPRAFFADLPVARFGRAFSFGWLVATLAVVFLCLYSLWQLDANREALLETLRAQGEPGVLSLSPEAELERVRDFLFVSLLLSPLLGALNLWLSAGLSHLGVLLAAGRQRGFVATFRATAFGFAPLLLVAIPLVGYLVGGLWSIALQVIAISQVHRIELGRAALAVLVPLLALLMALMLRL